MSTVFGDHLSSDPWVPTGGYEWRPSLRVAGLCRVCVQLAKRPYTCADENAAGANAMGLGWLLTRGWCCRRRTASGADGRDRWSAGRGTLRRDQQGRPSRGAVSNSAYLGVLASDLHAVARRHGTYFLVVRTRGKHSGRSPSGAAGVGRRGRGKRPSAPNCPAGPEHHHCERRVQPPRELSRTGARYPPATGAACRWCMGSCATTSGRCRG